MARPQPPPPPCELCRAPANLHCPSDEAFLCWDCDSTVHSANFLVARHSREFLCLSCSCPSSLRGSGASLPPHSHICPGCSSMEAVAGNSDSESGNLTSDSETDSNIVFDASQRGCNWSKHGNFQVCKVTGMLPSESGYTSEAMSTVEEEDFSSSADDLSSSSSTCSIRHGGQGIASGKHPRKYRKFFKA